jgi:MFS family permease
MSRAAPDHDLTEMPAGRAHARDGYRWTILAVACFGQSIVGALLSVPAALAPAIQREFALSLSEIGLVLASVQGGAMLTLLPWGILADRTSERLVIAAGMASSAAALAAAGYASTAAVFVAALVVAGMCAASVNAGSGRAVMGWFGPRERGFALGVRQTAGMVGTAAGAATLPTIAGAAGIGAALASVGAMVIAAAAVALLWMRDPGEHQTGTAEVTAVLNPLRNWRIWRITLGSAVLAFPQLALLGFVVLFLHDERGFSATGAGYVLASMALSGAFIRIVFGVWSDRLGRRILPLRRIIVALTVALTLTLLAMAGPDLVLVATLIVSGMLSMAWNGLSVTAVVELAGRERSGATLGLHQTIIGVMGVLAPVVFAAVIVGISWRAAFALLPLCPIVAYPFFLLRPRTFPRTHPRE